METTRSKASISKALVSKALVSKAPILMTSFRPWRSHQVSNSSDDLLAEAFAQLPNEIAQEIVWLRNVPVNFQMAPIRVMGEIYRRRPRLVICLGMAEKRDRLTLEQQAKGAQPAKGKSPVLSTPINLPALLAGTLISDISYDAGNYVCNHLYYSILESFNKASLQSSVLFIHVPILKADNKQFIIQDFLKICSRLIFL